MNKRTELDNLAYKKIEINEKYRFFNSNYSFGDHVVPFLKHTAIVERLKNRIRFSNGASFLITGLRGVGKTTLVKRALNDLKDDNVVCLPVFMNLSKKIEYKDLLFDMIRRLYESVIDHKIMGKINRSTARDIVISYSRTSMSIKNSNSINGETELSAGADFLPGSMLLKGKLTQQAAEEASFLAYSSNDVEHDFLRIFELLNRDKSLNIKIVLVFDELDKLTATANGSAYFEDILSSLKNIICSVDAVSIFIGGLDLYRKWNDDVAKINSLYDNIFSWHQYVPCVWDSTQSLFELFSSKEHVYEPLAEEFRFICESGYSNIITAPFKMFLLYINFKSKGIPRKIYSEFNHFIVWVEQKPYFQISEVNINEINAYSEIWEKISPIFEDALYKTVIEMDLTYITCFNMIEYFFAHHREAFTVEEIQATLLYDNLSPVNISQIIADLTDRLAAYHIIQRTKDGKYIVTDFTIIHDENIVIKDKTLLNDSADDDKIRVNAKSEDFDSDASFRRKISRYNSDALTYFWKDFEARELLLSNSEMAIFYVVNRRTHDACNAVLYTEKQSKKINDKTCLYNESSYTLTSRYLLDTTDIVKDSCIKTSLKKVFHGYLLSHLVDAKVKLKYVTLIIEQLLLFVAELNRQGFFNANIKPGNIMINSCLNVKLLDVKNLIRIGTKGTPISALGYAAPEMYTENFDSRSDLYSVGVLLWELTVHKSISEILTERHIDFQFLKRPSGCSRMLWNIIAKATKADPAERYQTAEEFLKDIYRCREYRSSRLSVPQSIPVGTVTNLDTCLSEEESHMESEHPTQSHNEYTWVLKDAEPQTVLFDGDDSITGKKVRLIRATTKEVVVVDKPIFKIGAEANAVDFCVSGNKSVSRVHASILTKEGNCYLIDHASTNHTFLNGMLLSSNVETLLKDGDVIRLANEEFIFTEQEGSPK